MSLIGGNQGFDGLVLGGNSEVSVPLPYYPPRFVSANYSFSRVASLRELDTTPGFTIPEKIPVPTQCRSAVFMP